MRIDLNPVALNNVTAPQTSKAEVSADHQLQGPEEDRTTLSTDAASLQALTAKAMGSPEIRQDRVDALRQAISSGQYKIEPDQIATAMILEAE